MILDAVLELRPNGNFKIVGDKLIWNDGEELRPTDEEIEMKVKELEAALPLKELRQQRNQLLIETDYLMVIDYPHTNKEAWIKYRQDLRDLPQTADLSNVEYPTKPIS